MKLHLLFIGLLFSSGRGRSFSSGQTSHLSWRSTTAPRPFLPHGHKKHPSGTFLLVDAAEGAVLATIENKATYDLNLLGVGAKPQVTILFVSDVPNTDSVELKLGIRNAAEERIQIARECDNDAPYFVTSALDGSQTLRFPLGEQMRAVAAVSSKPGCQKPVAHAVVYFTVINTYPGTSAPAMPAPLPETPVPAKPMPNKPAPAKPMPNNPAPQTPVPMTPAPQTPVPITPAPQTPTPQTPMPVTPAPQTPMPMTLAPQTPMPITPAPQTPMPVTPAPQTPMPMPGPQTPMPITPAPQTPMPITPAPQTPVPITPAPQMPMPTSMPVTSAPITPAPQTPMPITPAPITPAPQTPMPITPAPQTPMPITPAPQTPMPITPAPQTPMPITPAPQTPMPITPAPQTPMPITPVPITPAPMSPAPVTAAPSTLSRALCPDRTEPEDNTVFRTCIDLKNVTNTTEIPLIQSAVARWDSLMTNGLPGASSAGLDISDAGDEGYPAFIDDLYLRVEYGQGTLGAIGEGGFRVRRDGLAGRPTGGQVLVGFALIDVDTIHLVRELNLVEGVIAHEMGHALGIGTLWDSGGNTLCVGSGPYAGGSGNAQWQLISGCSVAPDDTAPVTNNCGHWEEDPANDNMDGELMCPTLTGSRVVPPPPAPISRVSCGSLIDLAYPCDLAAADPFTPPGSCSRRALRATDGKADEEEENLYRPARRRLSREARSKIVEEGRHHLKKRKAARHARRMKLFGEGATNDEPAPPISVLVHVEDDTFESVIIREA